MFVPAVPNLRRKRRSAWCAGKPQRPPVQAPRLRALSLRSVSTRLVPLPQATRRLWQDWSARLLSAELFARLALGRFPQVVETKLQLNSLVRRFRRLKSTRGTLVVVHGINPRGAFDPRLEHVAKAFAAIGFDVFMPNVPALEQLLVQPSGVDQIEQLVLNLTRQRELCPDGRLSLFGASISGAMSLIAATRPSIRDRIKAICIVGGFASTATVSEEILKLPPDADDYGRNVMFYNFVEYALGPNDALKHAFYLAIHDNHFLRRGTAAEALPGYLAQVDAEVASTYWRLQNDVPYRMHIAERVMAETAHLMRTLSPVEYVHDLRCSRVVLVHGKFDEVVPVSEAELLYAKLRAAGMDTALCITGFIGHGDKVLPPDSLGVVLQDALRMVDTWASFIEAAAQRDRRKDLRVHAFDTTL